MLNFGENHVCGPIELKWQNLYVHGWTRRSFGLLFTTLRTHQSKSCLQVEITIDIKTNRVFIYFHVMIRQDFRLKLNLLRSCGAIHQM